MSLNFCTMNLDFLSRYPFSDSLLGVPCHVVRRAEAERAQGGSGTVFQQRHELPRGNGEARDGF